MTMKFDRFSLEPRKMTETPEGFLTGDAIVTRIGVFNYGKTKEFRSAEEVFHEDSLESMKLVPITLEHPSKEVTPENIRALAVGYFGDTIKVDGENVIASYRITDPEAIKQIKQKKRIELSMGYKSNDILDPGSWKGDAYDLRHSNIRYNHCAIVTKGRAGNARFIMDTEEVTMDGVVKLDGANYAVPVQVETAFAKLDGELVTAKQTAVDLQSKLDTATAQADGLRTELEKAQAVDIDALASKKADSLVSLRSSASVLAPDLKMDGLSERQIMVGAVKSVKADFDDTDKSDDYVKASFDFYQSVKADSIAQEQGRQVATTSKPKQKTDGSELTGRDLMIYRQKNGGK